MPRQHANSEDLFTVMNDEERVDHWAALQKNKIKFPLFAWCFYAKWGHCSVDLLATYGSTAMCLAFSTCQQKIFGGKNSCEFPATYCVGCAASVELFHWTVPCFILSLFGRDGSSGGGDCLSLELWLLCVSSRYLFCWGTGLSFPWSATAKKAKWAVYTSSRVHKHECKRQY